MYLTLESNHSELILHVQTAIRFSSMVPDAGLVVMELVMVQHCNNDARSDTHSTELCLRWTHVIRLKQHLIIIRSSGRLVWFMSRPSWTSSGFFVTALLLLTNISILRQTWLRERAGCLGVRSLSSLVFVDASSSESLDPLSSVYDEVLKLAMPLQSFFV